MRVGPARLPLDLQAALARDIEHKALTRAEVLDMLTTLRRQTAMDETGLDPAFYTYRHRPLDETFPWDHIDIAVRKKFLAQDFLMSQRGETRVDCRERCFACGILPTFVQLRGETPAKAWECPQVIPKHLRGKQAATPQPDASHGAPR